MQFYGIQKVTLIDFPETVATTIFTSGCNFSCPFCHNPELVLKNKNIIPIDFSDIMAFLEKRKNLIQGVCITGGEPLLEKELPEAIDKIHSLGFKVKLDTNGSLPESLKKCKVDYIAMDIKTSFEKYNLIGCKGNLDDLTVKLKDSIAWIKSSGINHEFRTTVVPEIVTMDDIKKISIELKGAAKYVLAQFRPKNTLDKKYESVIPYPISVLKEMKNIIDNSGILCEIRSNY
jgi:pyruvate formate lyase activating enzyme